MKTSWYWLSTTLTPPPAHPRVIPRQHTVPMADLAPEQETVMGRLTMVAGQVAREAGCTDGYRTVVNTGRVGLREVYHLHIHILGGAQPLPPMLKH